MTGVPASPLIRLLLVLLSLRFGFPSGDDGGEPAAEPAVSPAAACSVEAAPTSPVDGRVRLVLEARPPAGVRITPETVCAARDVMATRLAANRIDATLVIAADYRILVDVPAGEDAERVGRLTTGVGLLEIVDPRGKTLLEGTIVTTTLGGPADVLPPSAFAGEAIDDSAYETIVSGDEVEGAAVEPDAFGNPTIVFSLTNEAAQRLQAFTSANIDQPMAILLDKRVISSPTISSAVSDQVVISGLFAEEEAADLAGALSVRPLPVPFELVSVDGTPVADGA